MIPEVPVTGELIWKPFHLASKVPRKCPGSIKNRG